MLNYSHLLYSPTFHVQVGGKGRVRAVLLTIVLCTFFVFGIGANMLVIAVTQYHRKILPPSSIFVLNLALVDFIFLLHLPMTIGK